MNFLMCVYGWILLTYGAIKTHCRDTTWSKNDMSRQSKIDFWLITNDISSKVKNVSIEPVVLTDHRAVLIQINNNGLLKKIP